MLQDENGKPVDSFAPDLWFMASIDLAPGSWDLAIQAHAHGIFSVDDTRVVEGKCGSLECPAGLFKCTGEKCVSIKVVKLHHQ